MSLSILLIGIVVSIFVGVNIGGSSTGTAWGAVVGAGLIRKTTAATVMTGFVFLGGWTVGRNVLETLSDDIVTAPISLEAGIAILFFIGLGILIANLFGVPVPTSMTTVGAIAGLGLATGTLNWETIGRIVSWWIVTPIIAFWIGTVVGRYLYPYLNQRFSVAATEDALFTVDRRGSIPSIRLGPNTTRQEFVGTVLVIGTACYMSFSAGASNVPNAVAPLVSGGAIGEDLAILIATAAIGLGGFTIARRTMESVGTELTDLTLLAAVVVMITSSSITTFLSYIGIPISLVMGTVMTIVGLGWGRASRSVAGRDVLQDDVASEMTMDVLTIEETETVEPIGKEDPEQFVEADELFNPQAVVKFVSLWIIGPTLSLGLSYLFFSAVLVV